MTDRSLRALGLDGAPAELPLTYPGRPVAEPALLTDGHLLPLRPGPGPLGGWRVITGMAGGGQPDAGRPGTAGTPPPTGEPTLDELLDRLGAPRSGTRRPVLAVGSNASPAQLHHKITPRGTGATVPMVPVRVRGIGIGCSAHIGRHGYVAAAPYAEPAARHTLVAGWLDPAQLAAVDETEFNYRRVWVPGGDFPMTLPSGEPLGGAYLYVSVHGVLADPATGRPRPGGGDQGALLTALLAASAELRALLGPGPERWVERARADEAVRAEGRAVFRRAGWARPEGLPELHHE
ncbi:hypothetical protein IPZ58_24275 [Streptomyces roseoverticillatus]|uniref:hypothetical protein n=1 Tax=Streptomyces roseoverticillatus TaxID=66429 RepID=UPI001F259302|nr:hypothetical protein [Streptomyces roseoverticillatus]MCF3104683.1 hypothetical protein [Streptomyces roseoverticillatus]